MNTTIEDIILIYVFGFILTLIVRLSFNISDRTVLTYSAVWPLFFSIVGVRLIWKIIKAIVMDIVKLIKG